MGAIRRAMVAQANRPVTISRQTAATSSFQGVFLRLTEERRLCRAECARRAGVRGDVERLRVPDKGNNSSNPLYRVGVDRVFQARLAGTPQAENTHSVSGLRSRGASSRLMSSSLESAAGSP